MLIGRHPSGLSVMIQYNGEVYRYQAKYNQGRHKDLEMVKRLAVIDSYPRDNQRDNYDQEMREWSWRMIED
jgi:hypothetical protein